METVVLNLSVHLNFYQENFSSVLFCSFLAAKSYQPRPQGAFPGFFFPPHLQSFRPEKRSAQASAHPYCRLKAGFFGPLFCVLTASDCVCLLLEF